MCFVMNFLHNDQEGVCTHKFLRVIKKCENVQEKDPFQCAKKQGAILGKTVNIMCYDCQQDQYQQRTELSKARFETAKKKLDELKANPKPEEDLERKRYRDCVEYLEAIWQVDEQRQTTLRDNEERRFKSSKWTRAL